MPGRSKKTEEKQTVQRWLEAGRVSEIQSRMMDRPAAINTLVSMLFQDDPILTWRLLFLLGPLAEHKAVHDLEGVRNQIRRLLWLMNDESGGIVWYAPQAVAIMLAHVPPLRAEFARILGSFLREAPFEEGAHWAVARLAAQEPGRFADLRGTLAESLSDARPVVRLCAADALESLGSKRHFKTETVGSDAGLWLTVMKAADGTMETLDLATLAGRKLFDKEAQWMVGFWSSSASCSYPDQSDAESE